MAFVEATRMVLQSPTLLEATWSLKFEIPWDCDGKHGLKLAPYFSSSFLEGTWECMDREIQVGELL